MSMQTDNQNVEVRLRSMRTLWISLILSIGGYFVLTGFVQRPEHLEPNNLLSIALAVATAATTLASFLIKSKLVARAIEQGQVLQVQQAYVVAWAVTEAGALFGVLDYFLTADRYYFVFLLIAAFAQLLHFPRSEHVANAAFKRSKF
jgi:hypothetical protein